MDVYHALIVINVLNVGFNIVLILFHNFVYKYVVMEKDFHFNAMMEITLMEMDAVTIAKFN
jgi:hypothetical protein